MTETTRLWICAFLQTLVPSKDKDSKDCPYASYPSHRHLPPEAQLDRCGWYEVKRL